jgi:hypothetical protein
MFTDPDNAEPKPLEKAILQKSEESPFFGFSTPHYRNDTEPAIGALCGIRPA